MGLKRKPFNFIHPPNGDRAGRRPSYSKDGSHRDGPRIFIDRAIRSAALNARDLTAAVFNDPPPGYSALDVKVRKQ